MKKGLWLITIGVALCGCTNKVRVDDRIKQVPMNLPEVAGSDIAKKVLVVCNNESDESIEIAEYYCRKRGIPKSNVLQLRTTLAETISNTPFVWNVRNPIRKKVKELKDIDYIVLIKGIPIRVDDSMGYSVDSLLAGMDLDFEPVKPGPEAPGDEDIVRMKNPFFNSDERFSHEKFGMYLVTRLDGYEAIDVKLMVERSIKAKPSKGPFYLDQSFREGLASEELDQDMALAAKNLKSKGFIAWLENTKEFKAPDKPVMGYCSWGSNDPKFNEKIYHSMKFAQGSIAETFVSTSGRTFLPEVDGQSQIPDLIRQGVCGVKGYVSEPWTIALCRPSILFDRYTRGWNLAESFYAASPLIKWKDVVVGDPLLAPYAEASK